LENISVRGGGIGPVRKTTIAFPYLYDKLAVKFLSACSARVDPSKTAIALTPIPKRTHLAILSLSALLISDCDRSTLAQPLLFPPSNPLLSPATVPTLNPAPQQPYRSPGYPQAGEQPSSPMPIYRVEVMDRSSIVLTQVQQVAPDAFIRERDGIIQVGAFSQEENAQKLMQTLSRAAFSRWPFLPSRRGELLEFSVSFSRDGCAVVSPIMRSRKERLDRVTRENSVSLDWEVSNQVHLTAKTRNNPAAVFENVNFHLVASPGNFIGEGGVKDTNFLIAR
jgi:hypothetical protein